MGHARDEERQHEQVSQADDAVQAEHEAPSKTRFTNQGAIPAVQNGAAAQGPTASERAYGSLTVTARNLNVRSGPSTNDRIVGSLHRGDSVQELGRASGWVQIRFGGQTAFVHEHYVTGGGQEARGHAPSPEAQAEAMEMFREVNGEQGRGHAPSQQAQAEAMQDFREVNGEQGRGHAPSKEGQAEAMQMFREVNGEPAAGHAPNKEKLDELLADLE